MKVGIVTHPLYFNYGGILQNYALQQVLKGLGHTPITLDYMPPLSFKKYLIQSGKRLLSAPFPSNLRSLTPFTHFVERPPRIESFVRNNIVLSRKTSKYTRHLLEENQVSALIVGSDQVWRYAYSYHYLEDMFLAFAKDYPCIKISYSASFGIDKWDYPIIRAKAVKELVRHFDAVSVREDSGVTLCKNDLGIDAVTTLDTTLLLPATAYDKFCSSRKPETAPFLAAYVLDSTEEKSAHIARVARAKGLRVKKMTASETGASIEEWLSSLKNADYVITDSYHGSLFSIVFRKPFETIINRGRGADRFTAVFQQLGLLDRLIDSPSSSVVLENAIDYASVCAKLRHLQKDSISYLESALSQFMI